VIVSFFSNSLVISFLRLFIHIGAIFVNTGSRGRGVSRRNASGMLQWFLSKNHPGDIATIGKALTVLTLEGAWAGQPEQGIVHRHARCFGRGGGALMSSHA